MADKDLPITPYAGTSGWSGSDASRERAEDEDATGVTTQRQKLVLSTVHSRGEHGLTWRELAASTGWHHGQATGALSNLHKAGLICRLKDEKRDRCSVYVLPEQVVGREVAAQGRKDGTPVSGLVAQNRDLRKKIDRIEELVKPKIRSYSYTREHLLEDIRRALL